MRELQLIITNSNKLWIIMQGKPVLDSKGNPTYEMVKDGTMTYYDLWPNSQVGERKLLTIC